MTRFLRALLIYSGCILSSLPHACRAQLGSTICVCSPATYEITFDFTRTCDNTALKGDGIVTSDCAVAPFQDDSVSDLLPVSVGSIDILELDENLVLLTQSSRFGTYKSGDSFPYESISRNPSAVNGTSYPRALQVSVIGNNAAGDTLFFAGLIVFVTDCSEYPNLVEGSTIGWIRFSKLETPNKQVCPASVSKPAAHDLSGFGLHASISSSGSGSGSVKKKHDPPTRSPTHKTKRTYPPTRAPVATLRPTQKDDGGDGGDCLRVPFGKKKEKSGKKKKKKSESDKHIRKKDKKGKYYYYDYYGNECYESKGSDKREKSSKKSKGEGKKAKKAKHAFNYDQILALLHHHSPTTQPTLAPVSRPIVDSVTIDSAVDPVPQDVLDKATDSTPATVFGDLALATSNQRAKIPDQNHFWGSPRYYFVLSLVVCVALTGVGLLYYNPRRTEEQRRSSQLQREHQMSIMKGIDQWSNSGHTWM